MGGSSWQSWDTEIDDADARFVVVDDFDGAAVLDRKTQLLWQRAPGRGRLRRFGGDFNSCFATVIGIGSAGACRRWRS